MCYIVFISHSLHWRYIKIALQEYVINIFIIILYIIIIILHIIIIILYIMIIISYSTRGFDRLNCGSCGIKSDKSLQC